MSAKSPSTWNRLSWFIAFALIALFVITVLRTAWISDDAYITFRSIENFIHGYGPVYNIGERVQTFTHPLWFFIQAGVNAVTQQIGALNAWAQMYYVSLLLSIAFSVSGVLIVIFGVATSPKGAILALIALTISKYFIDYATSGLENALTYTLQAVFLFVYFKDINQLQKLFWLSVLGGLMALNRLDTLLLIIPVLVWLIWQAENRARAFLYVLIGFIPLVLWELFSLLYYGFPFPNTAYAKLNTGIRQVDLILQGFKYYFSSVRLDPLTMVVILATLTWLFWKGSRRNYPILLGVVLYMLYMFYTGGDFMAGRFFTPIYLICAALLSRVTFSNNKAYAGLLAGLVLVGFINPLMPLRSSLTYGVEGDRYSYIDENGVADERAYYYPGMGLLSQATDKAPPGSNFSGRKWIHDLAEPLKVVETGGLGVFGYMVGPDKHVIDRNGLADPLMARLDIYDIDHWRIGHFRHAIPEGYIDTLKTGDNQIVDPGVAEYYEALVLVTRGDMLDPQRLVEIWKLNTGQYNHLIESYSPAQE